MMKKCWVGFFLGLLPFVAITSIGIVRFTSSFHNDRSVTNKCPTVANGTPTVANGTELPKIPILHPVSQHPGMSAAICTIVVNEEAYLDEFVDYHYGLGFAAIYIYDNSDQNELRQWGEAKGPHVVVHDYPGGGKMFPAYLDCAKVHGVHHTWVAFFDADEFLVLRKHRNVVDFLYQHAPSGALAINWIAFGTSGRNIYEPLPVTKRFLYRDPDVNQHVKSIVKMKDLNLKIRMNNPHTVRLKKGKKQIDTSGRVFKGPFNPDGPSDVAVLHHYHYKSRKEYVHKKLRGRSDIVARHLNRTEAEALAENLPSGSVIDDSAWQLMKKLVPKYRAFDAYEK